MKALLVLVLSFASTAALANVVFNSADGTGRVDSCDIQTAFGWDAGQLVANAAGVTFSAETVDNYAAVCTNKRLFETQYPVVSRGFVVNNGVVEYPEGPVFVLTGYGSAISTGAVPVIGGWCHLSSGMSGSWSAVEKSNSISGLFAHYGATKVLIY